MERLIKWFNSLGSDQQEKEQNTDRWMIPTDPIQLIKKQFSDNRLDISHGLGNYADLGVVKNAVPSEQIKQFIMTYNKSMPCYESLQLVMPHLSYVRLLDLSSNRIVSLQFLLYLNEGHLTHLNIGDNCITNIRALQYCNMKKVKALDISNNQIADPRPLFSCNFESLLQLRIGGNRIQQILVLIGIPCSKIFTEKNPGAERLRSSKLSRRSVYGIYHQFCNLLF